MEDVLSVLRKKGCLLMEDGIVRSVITQFVWIAKEIRRGTVENSLELLL
jgi:hypothetical protein